MNMTKVLTMRDRESLLKEALEKLQRACQILDECGERHEAAMLEMTAQTLGGKHEKLSIHSRQDSRYGHLRIR